MLQASSATQQAPIDVFEAAKIVFEEKFAAAKDKVTVRCAPILRILNPALQSAFATDFCVSMPVCWIYSRAQKIGQHHNLEWTYEGQLDSKGNFSGIGRMTFKHGGMYEGNLSLLVFIALFSDLCPPLRLSQESLPRSSGTAKEPCSCTTAPSTPVCYCRMPRSTYVDSSLITVFVTGQFVKNNFHGYGTLMCVCGCCV